METITYMNTNVADDWSSATLFIRIIHGLLTFWR